MNIAIIGGGISGLTASYELEQARKRGADVDWHLYESTNRLGGIIETTTHDGFILEGGPDGWVTEKPWARDLAIELGLETQLIYSNDATRKTYIVIDGKLQPIPDRMRLMVPEDLSTLENSPLFSDAARSAYAAELVSAAELKASAPTEDESIASFVRRHFGEEVLTTLAAPLLSGVFGGDVETLSVRAVMPAFVAMEREHGSLIAALQSKAKARGEKPQQPIFTSLRNGMGSLVEALVAHLPSERIHLECKASIMEDAGWHVLIGKPDRSYLGGLMTIFRNRSERDFIQKFDALIFATPLDETKVWLPAATGMAGIKLMPTDASSSILATFTWPETLAATFTIPPGFGFLVPQSPSEPSLLACTFVDQKFPHRAPPSGRVLRAFFGGASANALSSASNEAVAQTALTQLRTILGPIPEPTHTEVRRWPHSLPQYEVGHLERIAELDHLISDAPNIAFLGNAYRGVGLPDLIRDARAAARNLIPNP